MMIERLRQRWFRMNPADRRALTLVTLFLGAVLGYVYLIEPVLIRYQHARTTLDELHDQQRRFGQQVRMLPRRELKMAEYRAELATLQRRLELQVDSREAAVSRGIAELSYYARLTGVEVGGIRPLETRSRGGYVEVGFEVEASAAYERLHEFLYYIETSPSLLVVTDLDMSIAQAGSDVADVRFNLVDITHIEPAAEDGAATAALLAAENRLQLVISRWTGYAPLVVAKHEGYLDGAERRVELLVADDDVTVERLLVSGEADGVGTSVPALLDYWARGIPLHAVVPLASGGGGEGVVVRADSDLRTVADLRGRRVAVADQGLSRFVLHENLTAAGLSLADVTLDELGPSQVARQIAGGTLDAGLTREPFLSTLIDNGQARLLLPGVPLPPESLIDLLAVTPSAIEKKGAAVDFLLAGVLRAQRFIAAEPDRAARIVADWEGRPPARTAAALSELGAFDPDRTAAFFHPGRVAEQLAFFEGYREATDQPLPLVSGEDIAVGAFFDRALAATEGRAGDAVDGREAR